MARRLRRETAENGKKLKQQKEETGTKGLVDQGPKDHENAETTLTFSALTV
jgi:hypothetical protein